MTGKVVHHDYWILEVFPEDDAEELVVNVARGDDATWTGPEALCLAIVIFHGPDDHRVLAIQSGISSTLGLVVSLGEENRIYPTRKGDHLFIVLSAKELVRGKLPGLVEKHLDSVFAPGDVPRGTTVELEKGGRFFKKGGPITLFSMDPEARISAVYAAGSPDRALMTAVGSFEVAKADDKKPSNGHIAAVSARKALLTQADWGEPGETPVFQAPLEALHSTDTSASASDVPYVRFFWWSPKRSNPNEIESVSQSLKTTPLAKGATELLRFRVSSRTSGSDSRSLAAGRYRAQVRWGENGLEIGPPELDPD